MKLLILTQYFPPEVGAPQNRLYELAARLISKGISVTVLTAMPNYPKMEIMDGYKGKKYLREEMNGITIHRSWIYVPKSKSILPRLLNYFSFVFSSWWYGRKLKKKNFDFLLCESPPLFLGISAWLLSNKLKAKMIFNVSDLWPESAEKLGLVTNRFFLKAASQLEEFLYRKAAIVTGQTQGIVKNISSRFPAKKVYWLKNGVDLSLFTPHLSGWREQNGFSSNDFILLYAGILGHAQGLEVILKSAGKLREMKNVKFVLLGSGPEKQKLISMKEEMKLENVYFFDVIPKSRMPELLSAANAAIIPLRKLDLFKGAIPSKIFETLAMQIPVLLGVDGEARELFIEQGKAGLYFEPGNAADLTEKIKEMMNNQTLLQQMGINGRKFVSEQFNRDQIAEDFYNLLKENFKDK